MTAISSRKVFERSSADSHIALAAGISICPVAAAGNEGSAAFEEEGDGPLGGRPEGGNVNSRSSAGHPRARKATLVRTGRRRRAAGSSTGRRRRRRISRDRTEGRRAAPA